MSTICITFFWTMMSDVGEIQRFGYSWQIRAAVQVTWNLEKEVQSLLWFWGKCFEEVTFFIWGTLWYLFGVFRYKTAVLLKPKFLNLSLLI